jgi:hypothetical protein
MFEGEKFAGSSETGLGFIEDQNAPGLIAAAAESDQKVF